MRTKTMGFGLDPFRYVCRKCAHCQARPSPALVLAFSARLYATTPAPDPLTQAMSPPPIYRYSPTQPPSHRPPEFRKSQLHRQYTSLLRSTPLFLVFQHLNLTAKEWAALRRELAHALSKVAPPSTSDPDASTSGAEEVMAASIKMQIIRRGIFESALLVAEYYSPPSPAPTSTSTTAHSTPAANPSSSSSPAFTHALSRHAHDAVQAYRGQHPLSPLLAGPVALLTFPAVSPAYLHAALSVLAPNRAVGFAPPTRRSRAAYWEEPVQSALSKIMLLGAKVEDRVLDSGGVQWLGGKEMLGGIDGLRAQVVSLLTRASGGDVVRVLGQAGGGGVYMALEGRKAQLEQEQSGDAKSETETEQKKE